MDPTSATTFYLTQGVLGVTVFVEACVIVWQQRRIDKKDGIITDLQDKRVLDSDRYTSTYIDVAKEGVATNKDNSAALSLLQRSVDALTGIVQKVLDNK